MGHSQGGADLRAAEAVIFRRRGLRHEGCLQRKCRRCCAAFLARHHREEEHQDGCRAELRTHDCS